MNAIAPTTRNGGDGGAFGGSTWNTAGPNWSAKANIPRQSRQIQLRLQLWAPTDNASLSRNIARGGINYRKSLRTRIGDHHQASGQPPPGFLFIGRKPAHRARSGQG